MLLMTVKNKETTFVMEFTADSQLKNRDMESFCDKPSENNSHKKIIIIERKSKTKQNKPNF